MKLLDWVNLSLLGGAIVIYLLDKFFVPIPNCNVIILVAACLQPILSRVLKHRDDTEIRRNTVDGLDDTHDTGDSDTVGSDVSSPLKK